MNIYKLGEKAFIAMMGLTFIGLGFALFFLPEPTTTFILAPISILIGAYFIDIAFNLKLVKFLRGVLK
jgi:hypothetical protein